MANNKGKKFEELIVCIQNSVHKSAVIKANEKIKDIDTGKSRQVDITIRLSDGPTEFLGIVEVRDRNRPIGVRYVEEISGKLRSIGANAAFLVSRSGFTKTAIKKAKQIGIRVLTYEEARKGDWSGWIQCRTFVVKQIKFENPNVSLFEYGTDKLIIPSSKLLEIINDNPNTKIILDEQKNQVISLRDLIWQITNAFGQELHENVPEDGTHVKKRLLFQGNFAPTLWIECSIGIVRQIGKIGIEFSAVRLSD